LNLIQLKKELCNCIAAGHVRFGSKADIEGRLGNVRFTPKSGHRLTTEAKPNMRQDGPGFISAFCGIRYRNKIRRRETERRLSAVLRIGAKQ
jgi:hypothetical protein